MTVFMKLKEAICDRRTITLSLKESEMMVQSDETMLLREQL